ncbi:dTDP-4-dehydrorhamnose reductase [Paenibacillus alvei]|uniref:dTDP-4-dehydrorhamnose reductase n=1 Tax=Paenibacillus alvei TaxID=44250 RepID=UPI0013DB4B8E|nr:dTDP-4-dehydrorhamnose reductase [Paenibacillus alvei]MBG9737721.1 dTDP-4-dehydrorhamnose reductase [Paenibacillus alvei]MBG9747413.1 dTDP-4-dehydrorhamnose reductase [Paenibacillus alvei]MCY9581072.1 dTDP-4-dehydrorhamnose reductase [Paenibacillus alvei]MCY9585790.1 dTDP-4-dehydrorhamnose reductase [Paenibacillus alvei]NEZ40466.1 dTDP-4-dehydrorhamnose reductase [Paenibacillus alvei]
MNKEDMKVLVTGAGGQFGMEMLIVLHRQGIPAVGYGHGDMDVTDEEQVMKVMETVRPTHVIHAGAYTKVDMAESDPDQAYRVNAFGTRNVAVAASRIGAALVYISTDYVFDGKSDSPYNEFHPVRPINVYGRSKWEGERFVRNHHSAAFIIRTSWVFGIYGDNFVKAIIRKASTEQVLQVVHDQVGAPTYALDLAEKIVELLFTSKYGTYHITNSGSCSWHEFAAAIIKEAGVNAVVRAVPTSEFPRPARRPKYSVLEPLALRLNGFSPLRHWNEGLQHFLQKDTQPEQ